MAITTFKGFVTALGDLAITGINSTHRLNEPPKALNTAGLPCQWVQLPESSEGALTFQTHGGWPEFRAQLLVAYEPVLQNTQAANWDDTLDQLDNVLAAVRAAAPNSLGRGPVTWTIRPGVVTVAGIDYWAVIADVVGHG